MLAERLPPHDIQAEDAVIGSLLVDGSAITRITGFLQPDHFYRERNRWCYEACRALFDRDDAVNQVTVAHELESKARLSDVGGSAYLSYLISTTPTSVHIEHYARIVQRTAVMRQLISTANEIAAIGYADIPDVDNAIGQAEDLLFRIRSGHASRDFTPLRQALDTYLEETTSLPDSSDLSRAPIPTGFKDLDALLGGLHRSDMLVLAARPSIGKSTLALNICRNAAAAGAIVGIFSLEMGREQIAMRLLSAEARVDTNRLRRRLTDQHEDARIVDSIGVLSDLPIYVDDTPIQTPSEMRAKARRLQMERGLDLLLVDYMQLIYGSNRRGDANRVQEMSEISRALKSMARDLNVPVLAVSQLSRAIEQRPSHRPVLSDLRESGSIEQDADIVMFIHREDKYTSRDEWARDHPGEEYPQNLAEIMVAKHRHGPTDAVRLVIRENVARFDDAARVSVRAGERA
ncbi:MAG: replicative DNA helicase [Chloroflexi bacterium]|nr:replicative DNA helicase [Chloroflexota bacterium]